MTWTWQCECWKINHVKSIYSYNLEIYLTWDKNNDITQNYVLIKALLYSILHDAYFPLKSQTQIASTYPKAKQQTANKCKKKHWKILRQMDGEEVEE